MIVVLFHHTEVQKAISLWRELKYQSKGQIYNLHLLSFVVIRLCNVFLWERKTGFGKNCAGCGILMKKEREPGIRNPTTLLPDPLLHLENSSQK